MLRLVVGTYQGVLYGLELSEKKTGDFKDTEFWLKHDELVPSGSSGDKDVSDCL
jgi:hypothetical protein